MTPNDLIAAFETLADAPGGVNRLRELVLQLAVRGRLLAQLPDEEPPYLALRRIETARARLVEAGKVRKLKALPVVNAAQAPGEIPATWMWVRLDQIPLYPLTDGDWVESKDQDVGGSVRLTQLADVGVNEFRDRSDRFMNEATAERLRCTYLQAGDVLIARLPNPIGRACIFPGLNQPAVTVVDVAIARCNEDVDAQFVVHALNSPIVRDQVEAYGKGATRFRVATGHLRQVYVPLPPIAEQHRIVARVDELMGLLDRLETARGKCSDLRRAARDATLANLREAKGSDAVESAWLRIAGVMDSVFATAEDVGSLREVILQLAVRGSLVRQDPENESAEPLLAAARNARDRHVEQLTAAGRLRPPKKQPPVDRENEPFRPPAGWRWCRWGEIAEWITYGFTRPMPHTEKGVPIVTGKNVVDWGIDLSTAHFTTREAYEALSEKDRPVAGDILITKDGSIGRVAIIDGTTEFCINQSVAVIWLRSCPFSKRYLAIVLRSPLLQLPIQEYAKGAAVKHLSVTDLARFTLPVPPISEQHRIVQKVDDLMAICDELEARLAAARELHSQFAAAAVRHLEA